MQVLDVTNIFNLKPMTEKNSKESPLSWGSPSKSMLFLSTKQKKAVVYLTTLRGVTKFHQNPAQT